MSGTRGKAIAGILGGIGLFAAAFGLGAALVYTGTSMWHQNVPPPEELQGPPGADRDIYTPVEQRIQVREKWISQLTNPEVIRKENQRLSALYVEYGSKSQALGHLPLAEMAMQKACALHPTDPSCREKLANLYESAARTGSVADQRAELYSQAADYWELGRRIASGAERVRFAEMSASDRAEAAREYISAGKSALARRELNAAEEVCPADSPVRESLTGLARLMH